MEWCRGERRLVGGVLDALSTKEESNTYLSNICVFPMESLKSAQKWFIGFRCTPKATQLNMHLPWGDSKDTPTEWKSKQSHTKVILSERQAEQPGRDTESLWIQQK